MANTATLKPAQPHPAAALAAASPPAHAFAMLSHPGRIRHANEDACTALPELGAFVVCDGMGGAAAGEVASRLASEAFLQVLSRSPAPLRRTAKPPSVISPSPFPPGHPHTRLSDAIRAANQAVFRHSRKSQSLHGMGTTLVAALWDNDPSASTLWIAHIGDSRCYRLRRGTLELLTEDHSLVEEQIRAGVLTRSEAEFSPIRNIITRAIGSQPVVDPDIAPHEAQPGDLYLLASDGLTREINDTQIVRILSRASGRSLETACQALIDAANAHGGHDNITVLLISCT